MNDRQTIARLEAASPAELRELLRRPSEAQARVFQTYFGPQRYEALRRKILAGSRSARGAKRGNVVVLHGIMGGELNVRHDGDDDLIWVHVLRLALGGVGWLRMDAQGRSVFDVRATGILKKWYAEMIVGLDTEWNVQTYWYDWRRDLDETAKDLWGKINGWFGESAPVHLVAHSMGGLVARTYITRHEDRWKKGGKLIMLGTPNHGSFSIPQVITGALDTIRKLQVLDIKHNLEELTAILGALPGALQMLPSPLVMPAMTKLYASATWRGRVPQSMLDKARRHHDLLAEVVDKTRMHYIAGCNRRTSDDVRWWDRLDSMDGYSTSMNGDGTVPHRLGFLEQDGERIPTWFVQEDHGALPNNDAVVTATQLLLITDKCSLPQTPEGARGVGADRSAARAAAAGEQELLVRDEARLREITQRLGLHRRGAEDTKDAPLSRDEVEAAEIVFRRFLGESSTTRGGGGAGVAPAGGAAATPAKRQRKPPQIEIALHWGGIDKLPDSRKAGQPVDAIAVGHYRGVAPQNAELALDRAISGWKEGDSEEKLVITSLHHRGAISADLGRQFILPDRRQAKRLIVLAGMGRPGRFREAELTLLVRELVWMLVHTGHQHLATVLIGAGAGNLDVGPALSAWLRGVRRALYEAEAERQQAVQEKTPRRQPLRRITIVEHKPENFVCLHHALLKLKAELAQDPADPLIVDYDEPTAKTLAEAEEKAEQRAVKHARRALRADIEGTSRAGRRDPAPVRISVRLERGTYEFSALTAEASVPQRTTTVDPQLVDEINNQLPPVTDGPRQNDLGHLLGRMVLPDDLREIVMQPGIPTVLTLDATTARIHFERAALTPAGELGAFNPESFLGFGARLTRQLRSGFAPLPDPPILSGRTLRVLVVADPCEEAPLAGAQEEGEAVAQIFEQFGAVHATEVVRLFGPSEATRVNVLDQLVNHRFDVLHYAGHCFFDSEDPPHSGWLFSRKEVLSAYELSRVDRVPRFVFSNACESGITPDRADQRSAGLAPSFAEAFFARGVANFICTAWPVDDAAALAFATRLYGGLLGQRAAGPEPLHAAMEAARREIIRPEFGAGGMGTWGAYQHYGDPFFRF